MQRDRVGPTASQATGKRASDILYPAYRSAARVGHAGSEVDVSREYRTEPAERSSRSARDAIPDLVVLLTPGGEVEFVDRQILDCTGRTLDELKQWATSDIVHPEDLPHVIETFTASIASGRPFEIVRRLRRSSGAYAWFRKEGFPLRDADGQIVRWCVLLKDVDQRRDAQGALSQGQHQWRLIVESIPGLVATFTPAGKVEFVNRQVLEYFGTTLQELDHWGASGTTHPDDLPRVSKRFMDSIATGDPFEFELRARRYDGTYRWFQSRGLPLRDTDGHIVRWYNLLIDIDERKRAEAQLAGEIRLLEMMVSGHSLTQVLNSLCSFVEDTASDCQCGILMIDWSGLKLQKAAAPTLPDSYNNAIHGLPVRCETGPCARAACLKTQVISADIESDPLWQESPFRAVALANGLRSCWSTPIYSLAGKVLATFAIYQRKPASPTSLQQDLIAQVTHIASLAIERAQSEAALKRSEAFLAEGQRLSLSGSFFWRVATEEITCSDQMYRMFEFAPDVQVTLEMLATRVHPEDLSFFRNTLDRARRDGSDFEFEHRLQMPDHSCKYLHVVAHGTLDREGRPEYVGAVQDVTERRASEERLERARSELAYVARANSLGTLAASIAHEVNQPLSGIITNASTCLRLLAAHPPDIEGGLETARRMIRDGNRASDVIKRLRALFTNREFTLELLNLNDATREVIALSLSELQRNRVVLHSEFAQDLPNVTGDRVQIQQVILNLLRNASDAMVDVHDRLRQLQIRTEREEGDRVRLTVRDVGIGILPENMDKLFDSFYTTKSDGMGIGLSISRSIIEKHNGRLWAECNDGPGVTFSFSIPGDAQGGTRTLHALDAYDAHARTGLDVTGARCAVVDRTAGGVEA
jgi:PAS domain S-box-containing protein